MPHHVPLHHEGGDAEEFGALASGEEGFLGQAGGDGVVFLVNDGTKAKLLGVLRRRIEEPIGGSPFPSDGGKASFVDEGADLAGGES